ncbi:MAG: alpha/beta hydrolase fold domain-containing protein [Planctomycetaceae bacterium]|nr:alpha/beta hydrolase fold domain-containing protein [Planctomycetaceae bacterium]
MRRTLFCLVSGIASLILSPGPGFAVDTVQIVSLGDSITKGVRSGVTAEETFSSLIERELLDDSLDVKVTNVGIGGERTDQALKRFDQVLALEPQVVLIMYGTNDSYVDQGKTASRITVAAYRENLEQIAKKLQQAEARPILMTPPRWSADARTNGVGDNPNVALEPYVVACREVANAMKLPLVDHFAHWSKTEAGGVNLRDWTTDGCHPNPPGHKELARQILPVLGKAVHSQLALAQSDQQEEKPAPGAPTHADHSYGPDPRNVLDFWQAEGDGPRPLHVHIHGGGWTSGDKKVDFKTVKPFLDKGISYASINYRLTGQHPLPAPVHDAARAIQYLRSKAEDWNIRKDRITLSGGSAGACTSMWLLCHDDLADPDAKDPVLRESTRVTAAAVSAGQVSIDPKVIEDWLGPNVLKHRMINMSVGESTIEGALKNYDKYRDLYVEFSPYTHMSEGDPPLLMTYGGNMTLPSENAGHGIHHPVYGVKMKEKADACGVECHLLIPGHSESDKYPNANAFLMDKLLAP